MKTEESTQKSTGIEQQKGFSMKTSAIVATALGAILLAGVSFGAGMKVQQLRTRDRIQEFAQNRMGNFQNNAQGRGQYANSDQAVGNKQGSMMGNGTGFGGGINGMRPVAGEVIKSDDTSITIKLQDGSSKIILLSDSVTVKKEVDAAKVDVKVGETVSIIGTENTDGSVTAQTIRLNPERLGLQNK